ncbi:MAG: DNA gyrase inhibitor YacG [Chromatiales bacterium]
MAPAPLETPCPTCGRMVVWTVEARWRPFCSERCRLIDLGEWIDGGRRIPEQDPEDAATPFVGPDDPDRS